MDWPAKMNIGISLAMKVILTTMAKKIPNQWAARVGSV